MSIVNEEAILVVARYGFAQLLNRSFGSWVRRRVAMKDSAGTDLHHSEDVNDVETNSDGDHEIARHEGLGVVADKCIPTL